MWDRLVAIGKKCGKICFFWAVRIVRQETPFLNFYSRKRIKNYITYPKIGMGSLGALYLPPEMAAKNWPKFPNFSKILEKIAILEKN